MHHVTKYCNVIVVRWDTAFIRSSPDPSLLLWKWVRFVRLTSTQVLSVALYMGVVHRLSVYTWQVPCMNRHILTNQISENVLLDQTLTRTFLLKLALLHTSSLSPFPSPSTFSHPVLPWGSGGRHWNSFDWPNKIGEGQQPSSGGSPLIFDLWPFGKMAIIHRLVRTGYV